MGNKSNEIKCVQIVSKDKPKNDTSKYIVSQIKTAKSCEQPDFLSTDFGIEHFLADMFYSIKSKKSMSFERQSIQKVNNKIEEYRYNQELFEQEISNGESKDFVQNLIDDQYNYIHDFNSQRLIDNFIQNFDKHYSKINVYRQKRQKIIFLIEIPYIKPDYMGYVVVNNKMSRQQCIKGIPLPRKIITHIFSNQDIDYVILCIRPIFANVHDKDEKIIYIDVKNKKILTPYVVCDSFDYSIRWKNMHIKLEMEPR